MEEFTAKDAIGITNQAKVAMVSDRDALWQRVVRNIKINALLRSDYHSVFNLDVDASYWLMDKLRRSGFVDIESVCEGTSGFSVHFRWGVTSDEAALREHYEKLLGDLKGFEGVRPTAVEDVREFLEACAKEGLRLESDFAGVLEGDFALTGGVSYDRRVTIALDLWGVIGAGLELTLWEPEDGTVFVNLPLAVGPRPYRSAVVLAKAWLNGSTL